MFLQLKFCNFSSAHKTGKVQHPRGFVGFSCSCAGYAEPQLRQKSPRILFSRFSFYE